MVVCWDVECIVKCIVDKDVKCCVFGIFYDVFCLKIVFFFCVVINDRYIGVNFWQVFVIIVGNDVFVDLKCYVLESIKYIVNVGEIIRVVKINICYDCIIRLIV